MKKHVLIIGGLEASTKRQTDYAERFRLTMPEHTFTQVHFDQLIFKLAAGEFSITVAQTGSELAEFDLVMFRGKIRQLSSLAFVISRYCVTNVIPFYNDYSVYRPLSKVAQTVAFYEQAVSFIDTYYSLNAEYLKQVVHQQLEYPFILKDNYGAHGAQNYLVQDEVAYDRIIAENPDVDFIAQRYHPNNGDYRLLIIGDQPPLQIWRQAVAGSHLNNTSRGGSATLVHDLPDEWILHAKQLAHELGMSIAGVDLLRDTNTQQLYFLEVNSQPQFSGAFPSEKAEALAAYVNQLMQSA